MRYLLVLIGVLALVGCRDPFIPNPHLRLLRSDNFSVERPAVAPNGTEVYYLSGNTLWRLDISRDSASLLRPGWLQAIALSPDGTRLALLGPDLVLADTAGAILETLVPSESIGDEPIDVQFSHEGSHVYYSTDNDNGVNYYRVALDGTGRELVHQSYRGQAGFALTEDDSILDYSASRAWPEISPIDSDVMAYSSFWWSHGDVHLVYISTDSGFRLDCYPYSNSRVAYPSWFPDGRKLVFCATDNGLDRPPHYQLWMLDSVEY